MPNSINKVILLGNLTRDPEVKATANNQSLTTFGMATNRSFTIASGEKREQTDFHTVVTWGRLADLCAQYLKKGKKVYVDGRIQMREWTDEAGQKKFKTEIIAENVIFLDKHERVVTPEASEDVTDIVF
jgi:single-strand DNA-binding protein